MLFHSFRTATGALGYNVIGLTHTRGYFVEILFFVIGNSTFSNPHNFLNWLTSPYQPITLQRYLTSKPKSSRRYCITAFLGIVVIWRHPCVYVAIWDNYLHVL